MNSEDRLYSVIWVVCGIIVISFVLSVFNYNVDRHEKMVAAIEAGGDPIDVAVAFDNIVTSKATAVYLGKRAAQ